MIALAVALAAGSLLAAWFAGGGTALAGMAMGLAGTAFNIAALYGFISLASSHQKEGANTRTGVAILVIGLFVKLPVLIGLGLFAQRLGPAAGDSFLAGLFVVYAWLILFAITDARAKIAEERTTKTKDLS